MKSQGATIKSTSSTTRGTTCPPRRRRWARTIHEYTCPSKNTRSPARVARSCRTGLIDSVKRERGTEMDLRRHRKIIIYVLTFLAYAWSGWGAGLLTNLRDAVLAAETVFHDLFANVITVAKKIKDIHEVIDAAVEENCVFQCPDGSAPKADWNHKPQSDGCGSLGIQMNQEYLPVTTEMTKCCDVHDICYDTCNTDKEKCDLEFKRCLYRYCDTYQTTGYSIVNTCKAAAKALFTGTIALGCKSFLDAQKQACYCPDKRSKNKKPKKAAQAGGEL